MAKKSETEKQLASAASLIGMSHGRLAIMLARERVNLADIRAIIADLRQSGVILTELAAVLEQKQNLAVIARIEGLETVPAG